MRDEHVTWVVGSGGLLGKAVVRELNLLGRPFRTVSVPWSHPDEAAASLIQTAAIIAAAAVPWRVMWCAGAAVVGATTEQLEAEQQSLSTFLEALGAATADGHPGAVFLASSAGGVHAGSSAPPFTEHTAPRPISPYGDGKLASELLVREFALRRGTPCLIGRIANLYGPGQDLTKAQGLVSQLCRAHLVRQPLSIYVSLDTARDYVFAADAAKVAVAALDRTFDSPAGTVVVKLIASQQATTVASLLGELRRITRSRPKVVLGASPLSRFQTKDLRFRSVVWTELDALVTTGLPSGMFATLQGVGASLRSPSRP